MLISKKFMMGQEVRVDHPLLRAVPALNSRAKSQVHAIDPQRIRPSPPDDTGPIYGFNGERVVRIR